MKITGFLPQTLIDYPGKVASVIFTGACNYKCPNCHAKHLLNGTNKNYSEKEIFDYLKKSQKFIDGVVISGGEPTLEQDLVPFIKRLRELEFYIKLDTNGFHWEALEPILLEELVHYISLDVKGPPSLYSKLIGKDFFDKKDMVEHAMKLATKFDDYEFRTTIVPVIRSPNEISFLTPEEMTETAKWIKDVVGNPKYYLQKFVPRKEGLLDKRLEEFPETPDKLMQECYEAVKEILPNCKIR